MKGEQCSADSTPWFQAGKVYKEPNLDFSGNSNFHIILGVKRCKVKRMQFVLQTSTCVETMKIFLKI